MRSYETSRTIFTIVEFLAWCSLVLGSLFFVIGLNGIFSRSGFGSNLSAILIIPGVILVVFALLTIVTIQTARAGVDTAELTGQMLKVARDQLEVSRHVLRQGETLRASFEALKQPEPPPAHPRGFDTHDFAAAGALAAVAVRTDTPQPAPEPPARIVAPETSDPTLPEPPPARQRLLESKEELAADFGEPEAEPAPEPVFAEAEPIAVEPEPEPIPVDTGPRVFSHKGQTIVRSGADYHVLGQTFADLDAARARIDHFIDERARQRTT